MVQAEIISLKCAQYWFQIVLLYLGAHIILKEDITSRMDISAIKTMQYANFIPISRENKHEVLSILSYPTMATACATSRKVAINQPKPITQKVKNNQHPSFIKTKWVLNKNIKYTAKYFKKIS